MRGKSDIVHHRHVDVDTDIRRSMPDVTSHDIHVITLTSALRERRYSLRYAR